MKKILLALAAVVGVVGLGYGGYKLVTRNKDKKQEDAPAEQPEKPVDQPAPAEPEKPAEQQPNQEAQA
jgi:uncharacterized protein HemX